MYIRNAIVASQGCELLKNETNRSNAKPKEKATDVSSKLCIRVALRNFRPNFYPIIDLPVTHKEPSLKELPGELSKLICLYKINFNFPSHSSLHFRAASDSLFLLHGIISSQCPVRSPRSSFLRKSGMKIRKYTFSLDECRTLSVTTAKR